MARMPRPRLPRPRLPRPRLPRPRRRDPQRGRRLGPNLRSRLRTGVELLADFRWAAERFLRRLTRGLKGLWFNRSLAFRQRFALVVLVLGVYALFRFAALPGVPCQLSPAKECPPADDAIAFVPAGSLVYVHVNLDRDSSQFEKSADLAARLPHFDAIGQGTLQALDLAPGVDIRRDVWPWIGDEAAFAAVQAGTGPPRSLLLLAVDEQRGAERFIADIGGATKRKVKYRDVPVTDYRSGLASAEVDGFLALGDRLAVNGAIDTEQGRGEALSSSAEADSVRNSLPEHRVADAYVSQDGIKRLLASRAGLAAQLDTFTDFSASRGLAAALVAHDDGLEVKLDSSLDPAKLKAAPGFFSAFPDFEPGLAGKLSSQTLVYLGIAHPGETVRLLLDQASAAAPGLVEAFDRFNRELRKKGGIDLTKDVLPVLSGEAAVAIAPARPTPYATFLFEDVDERRARAELARLQAPLIAALNPSRSGQAPTFEERKFDDVVARSVRLSAALDLTYAIFDGRVVVSTSPAGVRQAVEGGDDLAGQDSYQAVTPEASEGVSALVFLNLEGLVKRAEPLGLNQIVGGFRADIGKLKALGLTVESGENSLTTALFLQID